MKAFCTFFFQMLLITVVSWISCRCHSLTVAPVIPFVPNLSVSECTKFLRQIIKWPILRYGHNIDIIKISRSRFYLRIPTLRYPINTFSLENQTHIELKTLITFITHPVIPIFFSQCVDFVSVVGNTFHELSSSEDFRLVAVFYEKC